MMGMGKDMMSTPQMAQQEPTILPNQVLIISYTISFLNCVI